MNSVFFTMFLLCNATDRFLQRYNIQEHKAHNISNIIKSNPWVQVQISLYT